MAAPRPGRGQPVAGPVRRSGAGRDRDRSASRLGGLDPDRLELEINEAVFLADREVTEATLTRASRHRSSARARQFRHRPFGPRPFARRSARQDQDRPELRSRRRQPGQPQRRHRPGHRRPRREPRHGYDRGGRRDDRGAGADPPPRLLAGPGLHLRQADAGRGGAGAGFGKPRRPPRSPASAARPGIG